MTDFSVVSRFRNKIEVNRLIVELNKRGKSCYNFTDAPADPNSPDADPEAQMKVFEETQDFEKNPYFRHLFDRDLQGLKEANAVILLLPAGTSAHIEIGIAYGLGKRCILIGKPEKPESLYLLFQERYPTLEDFLKSL